MKGAVLTLLTQVGLQLIGAITGIVVSRFLGADGRGVLAAVVSWSTVSAQVLDIGFAAGIVVTAAKSADHTKLIIATIARVACLYALPIAAFAIASLLVSDHDGSVRKLAGYFILIYPGLFTPLNLASRYMVSLLQGLQKFELYNVVRSTVVISYLVFLAAFTLLDNALTVKEALLANLLSNVVIVSICIYSVKKIRDARQIAESRGKLRLPIWTSSVSAMYREIFAQGARSYLPTLQPLGTLQLDVLLLTAVADMHEVGYYMVALAGATIIRAQGQAIGSVVVAKIASNNALLSSTTMKASLIALGIGAVTALPVMAWGDAIIALTFGPDFAPAGPVLRIAVAGAVFHSVYRVLSDAFRGVGQTGILNALEVIGAIVTLIVVLLAGSITAESMSLGVALAYVLPIAVLVFLLARTHSDTNSQGIE